MNTLFPANEKPAVLEQMRRVLDNN